MSSSPVVMLGGEPVQHDSLRPKIEALLATDLGFHGINNASGLHNFHAFPAKFPPQLPRLFIEELTQPGHTVLDPMMGSGTTIVEAVLAGRRAIGFDIDPMAVRLCKAKVTPLNAEMARAASERVVKRAERELSVYPQRLEKDFINRFDDKTREFIDYWFMPQTRQELMALLRQIEKEPNSAIQDFLLLAFSAIIITKSGGVSRARDLAHTRPHRVADKAPRPAIAEFVKRVEKNARVLFSDSSNAAKAGLHFGNAQALPLKQETVDLIVTSPPYASNAIDYMRAHKFSLVWFGHPLQTLSALRRQYIGGESATQFAFAELPPRTTSLVNRLLNEDRKKGLALQRYYTEMKRMLSESYRVLKAGAAAIIVVGSSTIRGLDTQTQVCIGEIGESIGFELSGIAERKLDRNRRMMPARSGSQRASQIEERMHEEYVIALFKPEHPQPNGRH